MHISSVVDFRTACLGDQLCQLIGIVVSLKEESISPFVQSCAQAVTKEFGPRQYNRVKYWSRKVSREVMCASGAYESAFTPDDSAESRPMHSGPAGEDMLYLETSALGGRFESLPKNLFI